MAWGAISLKYRNREYTLKESHHLNGRTNTETIAYLLGYEPSASEVKRISDEKEQMYEQICLEHFPLHLAPGAEELIEKANDRHIPVAIATSAGYGNIMRYRAWFDLLSLVEEKHIIYDNGSRRSKPSPDIYLDACKVLGIAPESCTVFEDAKAGILSARNAGIKRIYAVASPGYDQDTIQAMEGIHGLISDFSQYVLTN